MVLVPTGTPIYENVAAKALHPPTVLGMLRSGNHTGYARFTFSTSEALFIFQDGKLTDASWREGERRTTGLDAVAATFEKLAAEEGRMSAYRLSRDLTASVQALLHGEFLYQGQDLDLIDVKVLLDRVKGQRFTGCLRIYTADRTALIFYKNGTPLGFFHDGSQEIETSPAESQNIAKLPGAKLDALTTRAAEELVVAADLLARADLNRMWDGAAARQAANRSRQAREEAAAEQRRREAALAKLEKALRQILITHLGTMGNQVFDKALAGRIGRSVLKGEEQLAAHLDELKHAARLLTGASQTKRLLDEVRARIANWLANEQPRKKEE